MQKNKNDFLGSSQNPSFDLYLLIPKILNTEDPKNPCIDLNKLDYILREHNYHQDERKNIKKTLNLYKNRQGVLTIEGFRAFFEIPEKEDLSFEEDGATPEELGLLFDMISSVDGIRCQEIDLKKIKEFTKVSDIDMNDDRTLSVMYKLARNSETGKLMREDLMKFSGVIVKKKTVV